MSTNHATIVTGVSRGLGEALAADLIGRGHTVVGIGRRSSERLAGERYRFVECDLAQPARIAAAVKPALVGLAAAKPEAVTLVNNAAVAWPVGRVGRLDDEKIEASLATNIAAPFILCNEFLGIFDDDAMRRCIVNVSSGSAETTLVGSAAYSVAKAAIEMLTRTIVADHTAPNFRCVTLRPGIFDTGMQEFMRSQDPAKIPSVALFRGYKDNGLLKDPAEVAARIVDRIVLGDVVHGRTYTHVDL
jgi:NAD(P)-dependent dehydrogenase (short-subunit alcohol dehydrogenase family)